MIDSTCIVLIALSAWLGALGGFLARGVFLSTGEDRHE